MKNYRMEIYAVETTDGISWNVEFPEVPGCGGAGDTKAEAIEDAENNLKMHLQFLEEEGLPVPELTEFNLKSEFSGKFIVRTSKKLHKMVSEQAKSEGVSLNTFVVEAISNYCGEKNINKENQIISYIMPTLVSNYNNKYAGEDYYG